METILVSIPTNRVYDLILDYLTNQPNVKLRSSSEPSLIKAKVGSYLKSAAPCDAKIEIRSENGKTSVRFTFDFAATYVIALLFLIIGTAILALLFGPKVIILSLVGAVPIFIIGAPRHTSAMEKRFIDGVKNFLEVR